MVQKWVCPKNGVIAQMWKNVTNGIWQSAVWHASPVDRKAGRIGFGVIQWTLPGRGSSASGRTARSTCTRSGTVLKMRFLFVLIFKTFFFQIFKICFSNFQDFFSNFQDFFSNLYLLSIRKISLDKFPSNFKVTHFLNWALSYLSSSARSEKLRGYFYAHVVKRKNIPKNRC